MSKHFWVAIALIFCAFAAYETAINFYLRRLHTTAVQACFPEQRPANYVEASYEL